MTMQLPFLGLLLCAAQLWAQAEQSISESAALAANAQAEADAELEAEAEAATNPVTRFISTKDTHAVGELKWSNDQSINGKNVDSTYGEWTVEGEKKWLQTILQSHKSDLGNQFEKADFWDFGSGRGLATLTPWFEFNFQNAYGVEAVDVRFQFACSVLQKIQEASQKDTALAKRIRGKKERSVNFFHSDFDSFQTELKGMQTNPAVAWSSSLCFGTETKQDLAKLVALLPHNSLLATTSPLSKTDGFKSLGQGAGDMSWTNDSKFHLYKREQLNGKSAQPSFLEVAPPGNLLATAYDLEREEEDPSEAITPAPSKKAKCTLVVPVGDAPLKFEKASYD